MVELGKTLMLVGGVILCIGVLLTLGGNLSWLRWIGRLPGDIRVSGDGWMIYAPIATSLVLSVLLTVVLSFVAWARR